MVPFVLFVATFSQGPVTLESLEKTVAGLSTGQNYDPKKLQEVNLQVLGMVERGEFKTGDEFRRASKLISEFRNSFEVSRVKHELTLCALASGDDKAKTEISRTWDMFLLSTGREQRIGSIKVPGEAKFEVIRAPKSVFNVISNPAKALETAQGAKSDEEVKKICDDDQAVRSKDWSKMTTKEIEEMSKGDKTRLKRILDLLALGRIRTSEDFDRASLVLQHGSCWRDYSLAHELSICSLLLGNKKAAWLSAATYDRMLGSGGYRQRFGTQYGSIGGGFSSFTLDPVDTMGICDAERKALHCPTLEEARNRKWD